MDHSNNKPLCRHYIFGRCKRGDKCRFYHPPSVTYLVSQEIKRKSGHCFCGALLQAIVRAIGEEDDPLFYMVCSKTRKSIRKCQ